MASRNVSYRLQEAIYYHEHQLGRGGVEMIESLDKVVQMLGMLKVSGYDNCAIIVACINEINNVKKEVSDLGNSNK